MEMRNTKSLKLEKAKLAQAREQLKDFDEEHREHWQDHEFIRVRYELVRNVVEATKDFTEALDQYIQEGMF